MIVAAEGVRPGDGGSELEGTGASTLDWVGSGYCVVLGVVRPVEAGDAKVVRLFILVSDVDLYGLAYGDLQPVAVKRRALGRHLDHAIGRFREPLFQRLRRLRLGEDARRDERRRAGRISGVIFLRVVVPAGGEGCEDQEGQHNDDHSGNRHKTSGSIIRRDGSLYRDLPEHLRSVEVTAVVESAGQRCGEIQRATVAAGDKVRV